MRNVLWLACVAAGANGLAVRVAKRDAIAKKQNSGATTAREVAANTQTTRPVFEQGRRLDDCDVTPGSFTANDDTIKKAVKLWFDDRCKAIETYGHISTWNTSGVTNMEYLFSEKSSFDEDISAWDTSGVTDMHWMFSSASSFNQPLSDWRVDKVTEMVGMFRFASAFNQPIGGWRVDKVVDMREMFRAALVFNQPIGSWRVDAVTDMFYMFDGASAFNQPLNDWRVGEVTDMRSMFSGASAFNQAIGDWRVDNVTDMGYMFDDASSFNQPLNDWRVDRVTDMYSMFSASAFNQPLDGWKVENVKDMGFMFSDNSAFDQPIGGWRVDKVTNMVYMFDGASSFNQPLSDWRVDKVTHMVGMFHSALSFNRPLNDWRVDEVTDMRSMFSRASSFNQPLNGWRVDKVTSMRSMFLDASSFNQPLNDWRVDNVTTMRSMFLDASSFDQRVPWCLSDAVETISIFSGAKCGLNCYSPCSGNGICADGTCQCISTFIGRICDACAAGFHGVDCKSCEGNTWSKPGVGQTCDECRVGFYRATSKCVSCGEDKVCETTDVTLDDFQCIAGTYRDGDECKPCKHGMKCETQGVTLQNVRLEHDEWRTSENSDKIETCPLDNACRSTNETQARRRLDESQDNDYDAGENLCASGYHGPLCAVCRDHHYRSGNECKKCSRGSEALNIILACAVFVGFVVAAALSIIYSQNLLKRSMDYFKKGEEAVDGLADNAKATEAIWRTVKTAIKQMLGMWSVVSNTPWILDVTYPKIFDKVLAFLSNVFSFDFTIAADCAVDRLGFKDILLLNTLVPFVLCALIALLALVVAKWPRKKMPREQDGVQAQSVQYAFNLILFIVFLSYTTASTTIFRALRPCHKFDEDYHGSNKYMKDDYGTSCRSSRHDFIRAYAWIMLFIYPIGVPLLTFVFLWRHRETLNPDVEVEPKLRALGGGADGAQKKSVGSCTDISLRRSCHALLGRSSDAHGPLDDVQREIVDAKIKKRGELIKNKQKDDRGFLDRPELFGFMYDNYEPEYWWFECFDYIRRLLLTGILVVFEPGSATQGLFGVLVALFGTQVYSWTRPFPENAGDRLAESAQWSTFFTFLAALMILVNVNAANSTDQTIFGVLLIVIQFMPIAIGVGVGALNKNSKAKGKAQGLDEEAKGLGDKISSEEPEASPTSPFARGAPPQEDEEQPVVITE